MVEETSCLVANYVNPEKANEELFLTRASLNDSRVTRDCFRKVWVV